MQEQDGNAAAGEEPGLIQQYRNAYEAALRAIDTDVGNLIHQQKEMQALLVFSRHANEIYSVHSALSDLYKLVRLRRDILEHFDSKRLHEVGHKLWPLFDEVQQVRNDYTSSSALVMENLGKEGFKKEHWGIDSRILTEVEYMLYCLSILVEPSFLPLLQLAHPQSDEDKPNRHIPSSVKIAVWRRDEGKCVSCGSKEKLEYDHIIPVSKGGANTERNVQLLCEKCNRQKSANIQ